MDLGQILRSTKTIAVVGISDKIGKAGNYVPAYLAQQGYQILGVSPALQRTLLDLEQPIDLVLLFRRSEDIPGHLEEILQVAPRVVWMQSGIRHESVTATLEKAGILVVQDRCMMVEHQRCHPNSPTLD